MLTADAILHASFGQTKFRPGYQTDEVDDFLHQVAVTLKERGTGKPGTITPADVRSRRFRTTRTLTGYEIAEVDDFLREVAETLEAAPEQHTQPPNAPGDAQHRRSVLQAIGEVLIGERPAARHPRAPRAPRVAAQNVTLAPTGVTWKTMFKRGFIPVANIAEIALLDVTYTSGRGPDTVTTNALVLARDGAAYIRVGPRRGLTTIERAARDGVAYRKWMRSAWDVLGVPVERHNTLFSRPKDFRRMWPEAFRFVEAYIATTCIVGFGLLLAVAYVLGRLPS
jgi:DivIVA domain-containing protein